MIDKTNNMPKSVFMKSGFVDIDIITFYNGCALRLPFYFLSHVTKTQKY